MKGKSNPLVYHKDYERISRGKVREKSLGKIPKGKKKVKLENVF